MFHPRHRATCIRTGSYASNADGQHPRFAACTRVACMHARHVRSAGRTGAAGTQAPRGVQPGQVHYGARKGHEGDHGRIAEGGGAPCVQAPCLRRQRRKGNKPFPVAWRASHESWQLGVDRVFEFLGRHEDGQREGSHLPMHRGRGESWASGNDKLGLHAGMQLRCCHDCTVHATQHG